MAKEKWDYSGVEKEPYEGVRFAEFEEIGFLPDQEQIKIVRIIEAMEMTREIAFVYTERLRIVAPFAVGFSSEGNPLLRGYQMEGESFSRKGCGWRVFQVVKMEEVELHWVYFNPDEFDFVRDYPWIYRVIKMV